MTRQISRPPDPEEIHRRLWPACGGTTASSTSLPVDPSDDRGPAPSGAPAPCRRGSSRRYRPRLPSWWPTSSEVGRAARPRPDGLWTEHPEVMAEDPVRFSQPAARHRSPCRLSTAATSSATGPASWATVGPSIPRRGGRRGPAHQTLQLKGAGPTPYSRSADGFAVLRSSVREFLCSEAMHHLGVPPPGRLSLVVTGDKVVRDMFYDGNPRPEPGAVVCRVAPSFLRFGNFQLFAARNEPPAPGPAGPTSPSSHHFPELAAEHGPGSPIATCAALVRRGATRTGP